MPRTLYPQVLLDCTFDRLSSRFSEYGFQSLRCADKNGNTFSFKHGEELIRNTTTQLEMEAASELVWPSSRRGAPRGKARAYTAKVLILLLLHHKLLRMPNESNPQAVPLVFMQPWNEAEARAYYPTDEAIIEILDRSLAAVSS